MLTLSFVSFQTFFPVFVHIWALVFIQMRAEQTHSSAPLVCCCCCCLTLRYSILSNTTLDYLENLGQKMGRELVVHGKE